MITIIYDNTSLHYFKFLWSIYIYKLITFIGIIPNSKIKEIIIYSLEIY